MSVFSLLKEIETVLETEFGEIPDGLVGPVRSEDKKKLISSLGRGLPEQLEELLNIHNGESQAAGIRLLEAGWLLPAETIGEDYQARLANASRERLLDIVDSANFRAFGPMYCSLWRSGWIPFMEVGKDPWVIDLDPYNGAVGQVVSVQVENCVVM